MIKNTSIFFALTFLTLLLHAQGNYMINESNFQKVRISFSFENLQSMEMNTEKGIFSRIFLEGCGKSNNFGEPELPIAVNLLEIPFYEDFVLNVYGKDCVIYNARTLGINFPVYPAQPPVSKSHEGPVEFIQNNNTYKTDAFYNLSLAQFERVGFMRNVNLGQLYVSPVQYNPVSQEFKMYKSIDVEIVFKQTDIVKTEIIKELHKSPLFTSSNVINNEKNNGLQRNVKVGFSNVPIKYLIVAHSMFRGVLDEFIAWKKRKGFIVEVGYTDQENVGITTSSIAAYIKSHYDNATQTNPAPTFVLLVGDVQQIPAFTGITEFHPTDLYYFTWEGGYIPCCYYGRFSAQNITQLTPQIEKTLQYEQYSMPNSDYLNKISLVSGFDKDAAPIYGNGFLNYVTDNYANAAYGYSNVYAHYHPCNLNAEQIRTEIGDGVGLANFTAHCNEIGWSNPDFATKHISAMNNANKYGLMIGNCCLSNKFDINECYGEALLRAAGKGAVGYIGSSNNTYWDEDFYWGIGFRSSITKSPVYNAEFLGAYDRLFHTHREINAQWMITFGAMIFAGNEAVLSSTSSLKQYYWEIYHLMGDPSVITWLTKPARMIVGIHNEILAGETRLSAKVAPYSYCAFTCNKEKLLSAGFADVEGNITLHFEPVDTLEEYEFAAWAQNYVQYLKKIKCSNTKKGDLVIYPNPAHITMMVITKNQISAYEIIDLTGKVVASQKNINENITPITVSSLANGLYFIKITDSEKKNVVRKFVKQ